MKNSLDCFEGGKEDSNFTYNYPQCKCCVQRDHKDNMSVTGLCKSCNHAGIIRKVSADYDNS